MSVDTENKLIERRLHFPQINQVFEPVDIKPTAAYINNIGKKIG